MFKSAKVQSKFVSYSTLCFVFVLPSLSILSFATCSPAFCQNQTRVNTRISALPPCNLDSFVAQAGSRAENIYGDEGINTKPPLAGFTKASRIDAGITDSRDLGLTTGHGTCMPDAWGTDEFTWRSRGEWGRSGITGDTAANGLYDNPPLSGPDNNGVIGLPGAFAGNNLIPLPVNGSLSLVDNATPYLQDLSAAEGLIPPVSGFTAPAGE